MKTNFKQKSIKLRQKGYSIKEIAAILSVSKGSVSTWVRDVILTKDQKLNLKYKTHSPEVINKRRNSRLRNELFKRQFIINKASEDIGKIDKDMLKMIGISLYWGEGGKTNGIARISNSDPSVIKVAMRFFREICKVDENRFRAHIHIHSKEVIKEAEKYWSNIIGIPITQFYKTYSIKSKSSKNIHNKLQYGTVDVGVCDTKLLLTILGWIEGVKKQLI